ncbi:uncharacterized protein METZ01_LOCUS261238, partial [marine metagenome]
DNNRVQKFTSEGAFISTWGTKGGEFDNPVGVAVASDGSVYVAVYERKFPSDTFFHRIQKFTSEGAFISTWGTEGTGDGEFDSPHDVAVTSDGSVYVADTYNHRIQKFTSDGVFVSKWGTEGYGDGQFNIPNGVAVASDGSVYVAESGNGRIQKFLPCSVPLIAAITSALEAEDEEGYQSERSVVVNHLAAGTDPNQKFTEISGEQGEEGGLYPLHLVISTCYANELGTALGEIDLPGNHADRCTDLAELLIESGADINLPTESVLGSSPLHLAALHGQLDLAKLLVNAGASVNQLDLGESTPLDSTAMARLTIASFALWGMEDLMNESAVDEIAELLTERGGVSNNPIP